MMNMTRQKFTHPFKRSKVLQGIKKIKAFTTSLFIGLSETVKKLTEKMKTTLHKVLAKSNKQFLFFSQQKFYFDFPLSAKPLQSRMGKGKANIKEYIAPMTKSLETFVINPLKANAKLIKVLITKTIKQKVSYKLLKQFSYKNIENKKKVNLYSLFQEIVININSIINQIQKIVLPYFESLLVYNEWYDPIIQELVFWISEKLIEYFKIPEVPNPNLKPITLAPEIAKELPIITKICNKLYAFFNIIQVKLYFYHYCYPIYTYITENFFTGIFIDKYSLNLREYLFIKEEMRFYNFYLISSKIIIILILPLSIILLKIVKKLYINNFKDKFYNLIVNLEKYTQLSENKWKNKYNNYSNIEKIKELNNKNFTDFWFYCNLEIKELNKQIVIIKKKQITYVEKHNEMLKKYIKFMLFLKTPLEDVSKSILQSQLRNNFGLPIIIKEKVFNTFFNKVQKANKTFCKNKLQKHIILFNFNETEQRINNLFLQNNIDKYISKNQPLNKVSKLFLPYEKKILVNRNKKIQSWFDECTNKTFKNNLLNEQSLEYYYTALVIILDQLFEEIKKQKDNEKIIVNAAKKTKKQIIKKEKISYDILKKIVETNDDSSKKELKEYFINKLNIQFDTLEKETQKKFENIVDIAMENMLKKHIFIKANSTYTKNDKPYYKYMCDFEKICKESKKQHKKINNYRLGHNLLHLQYIFNIDKTKDDTTVKPSQEFLLLYIIKYPYLRLFHDETFIEETFFDYMYTYYKQFMQNHFPDKIQKEKEPKLNIFEEIEKEKLEENFLKKQKILEKPTFYKKLIKQRNINEPILQNITRNFVLQEYKYREKILCYMEQYFNIININKTSKIEENLLNIISKFLFNIYFNKLENQSNILLKSINKINDSYLFIINNFLKYNKDFVYIINNINKSALYKQMLNIEFYKRSKTFYKEQITKNQMATLTSAIIEHEKTIRNLNMLFLQEYVLLLNKKQQKQENQLIEKNTIINKLNDLNNWLIQLNKKINNIQNKFVIYDKKVKNDVEEQKEELNIIFNVFKEAFVTYIKQYQQQDQQTYLNKVQTLLKETTKIDVKLDTTLQEVLVSKYKINHKQEEIIKYITKSRKLYLEYQDRVLNKNKYFGILYYKDNPRRNAYNVIVKIVSYSYLYQHKLMTKFIFLEKMLNKLRPIPNIITSFEEAEAKQHKKKFNRLYEDKNNNIYMKNPRYIKELLFADINLLYSAVDSQKIWYKNNLTIDLEEFFPYYLYSENYQRMNYIEGLENFSKFPLTKHNYFFLDNGQKCHLINVTKQLAETMTYSEIIRRENAWHLYRASTKQRNTYSVLFYHLDTRFGRRSLDSTENFEFIKPENLLLPIFSFHGIHEFFDVTLLKLNHIEFIENVRYLIPDFIEVDQMEHFSGDEMDDDDDPNLCSYSLYQSQGPFQKEDLFMYGTKKEAQKEFEDVMSYGTYYYVEHPFFKPQLDRSIYKALYQFPLEKKQKMNIILDAMTEYSIDKSTNYYNQLDDCQKIILKWVRNKPFGPLFEEDKKDFLSNEQCQKHVMKFTNVFYDRVKLSIVNERLRRERFPQEKVPSAMLFDVRPVKTKKLKKTKKTKKTKKKP